MYRSRTARDRRKPRAPRALAYRRRPRFWPRDRSEQIRGPILDPFGFEGDDDGFAGVINDAAIELVGWAGVGEYDRERRLGRGETRCPECRRFAFVAATPTTG